MEADENTPESLPPWVMLEYSHILERTFRSDRENRVFFTNLSPKSASILSTQLSGSATSSSSAASSAQRATAHPLSESVEALIAAGKLPPKPRICLLDPKAEKAICPEDAEEFDAFLFGGILGDDPPRDRTKELRKLGFPGRHLDKVQMTTDTAVYVTSLVVDDGRTAHPLTCSYASWLTSNLHRTPRQTFVCRLPNNPVQRQRISRDAFQIRKRPRVGSTYHAKGYEGASV